MKPCDNCKKKKTCGIVGFLKRHANSSPWELDDYFHENFVNVAIITATSGAIEDIVLECGDYNPVKEETNYSRLANHPHLPSAPSCEPEKCGKCKGKCK